MLRQLRAAGVGFRTEQPLQLGDALRERDLAGVRGCLHRERIRWRVLANGAAASTCG
ncbi:hypothetical protein [Paenibacillus sp. UNC451MF]|uniref:hypothetical protein n=1 Tax=Paenibacillus sp. UNC451MF TaxID=1449063 RepID=UPI001E47F783|nr:hypothetical protein [Paenibacillus sp. UNC451MF]